jgi:curved DNA-binding protein CbpA
VKLTADAPHESASVHSASDAFRVLCLHATASRELIEGAYWSQVVRLRQESGGDANSTPADLRALNEAYATLIERAGAGSAHARHHAAPRGRGPRIGRPSRRKATAAAPADHYAALSVSPEADATLIELAYDIGRRRFVMGEPSREARLIDDAYRTLADPHARAAYDARYGFNEVHRPAPAPAPPREANMASPVQPRHEPPAAAPHIEPVGETASRREAPSPKPTVEPPETRVRRLGRPRRTQSIDPLRDASDDSEPYARGVDPLPAPTADAAAAAGDAPVHADARLAFVDGPRSGESVALTGEPVVLGSGAFAAVVLPGQDRSVKETHARIWRHNGRYILHQVDQFSTVTLNGDPLGLRLAVLDDGDSLRIGTHMLRFQRSGD